MLKVLKYIVFSASVFILFLGVVESKVFSIDEKVFWEGSSSLIWDDFRQERIPNSIFAAAINSRFSCELPDGNLDSAKVVAFMNPYNSWAKDSSVGNWYLLRHEQYHFNLTEVYSRKLKKALHDVSRVGRLNESTKEKLYRKYYVELLDQQNLYDFESDHSLVIEKQKDWEYDIDSMLVDLSLYSDDWIVFLPEQEKENSQYYRRIYIDCYNRIVGRFPISEEVAERSACYKFGYEGDNIRSVCYLDHGKPAVDAYLNVAKLEIEYGESGELWKNYDGEDKLMKDDQGVYVQKISRTDSKIVCELLDENMQAAVNIKNVHKKVWKLDTAGRRAKLRFYDRNDKRICNNDSVYFIARRYDANSYVSGIFLFGGDLKLQPNDEGIAVYKYENDLIGNTVKYETLDEQREHKEFFGQKAIGYYSYDINGNTIRDYYKKADQTLYQDENRVAYTYYRFDNYGNQVETSRYGRNKNLIISPDGVGRILYTHNDKGGCVRVENYDAYGNPLCDNDSSCVIEFVLDDENIVVQKDRYTIDTTGTVRFLRRMKLEREDGKVVLVSYLDSLGEPQAQSTGEVYIEYCYDEQGNNIADQYLNVNKEPVAVSSNVARFEYKYDSSSKKIETRYYGIDGKLTNGKDSIAMDRYKYDQLGRVVERSYWNEDGDLQANADGVQIIRYEYDGESNNISREYFLSDSVTAISNSYGVHAYDYDYDESGNIAVQSTYNTYMEPVCPRGQVFCSVKRQFNDRNQVLLNSYYSSDGTLARVDGKYSHEMYTYDPYGNIITQAFLSANMDTVNNASGYALVEMEYDNNDNAICAYFKNAQGDLVESPDGYAIVNSVFNRNGTVVKNEVYGADAINLAYVDRGPFHNSHNSIPKWGDISDAKELVTYHDNGNKASEVTYINGKPHGIYKTYYEDGTIESFITYVYGKREGKTVEFYRNGKVKKELRYSDNTYVYGSECLWYDNGNIKQKYVDGEIVDYDSDGNQI